MSKALSILKRKRKIKDRQTGMSFAAIAEKHKTSYQAVRRLCRRFEQEGEAGIKPRYARCGPQGIQSDPFIYRVCLWLKRLHRNWGAPLILLKLKHRYPEKKLPNERTLQIWFRQAGLNVPRSKHPKEEKSWASKVHQV